MNIIKRNKDIIGLIIFLAVGCGVFDALLTWGGL